MFNIITRITAVAALACIAVLGIHNHNDNASIYQQGMYDGAHDLCQEIGGDWRDNHQGWCFFPVN